METKMEKIIIIFNLLESKKRIEKKKKQYENKRNTYSWQYRARNIHELVIESIYLYILGGCGDIWLECCAFISQNT